MHEVGFKYSSGLIEVSSGYIIAGINSCVIQDEEVIIHFE